MSKTLTIPIGPNAHVDGGPYEGFSARDADEDSEPPVLHGREQEDNERSVALDRIEDNLTREMESHEPIQLNTGDVSEGFAVGNIRLPLVDGFMVVLHQLPGQGNDNEAVLSNLRDDTTRRRHFERQLKQSGGTIESI
jgi:hypothetical protein